MTRGRRLNITDQELAAIKRQVRDDTVDQIRDGLDRLAILTSDEREVLDAARSEAVDAKHPDWCNVVEAHNREDCSVSGIIPTRPAVRSQP